MIKDRLKEITSKIEADKEVLSTLPKNNQKNINAYSKKVKEIKEQFDEYQNLVLEELNERMNKIDHLKEDKEIASLEEELNGIEGILYLLNETETSYEKMDLDQALHNLSHYYQKNLEEINQSIIYIIKKFNEVGIKLEEEDFCYSRPSKEYLSIVLFEIKNEKMNTKRIKSKFEEIYWKCPDIIAHVETNIRYLYYKNEKIIDKYFEKQKNNLLKKFTAEELKKGYWDLKRKVIEKKKSDKTIIINNFISGNLNTKDFSKASIKNTYEKFISPEVLRNADETKQNEIDINLIKLLNSVYEYKNFLNYKYIVDNIKEIYNEKEKYKNVFNTTKKEIEKKQKKVISLSNKIEGKGLFKKPNDKYSKEQNDLILEAKELYKELEKYKVYNKVATELDDSSTLYDVLEFASCFYKYLFECIITKQKEITEKGVQANIEQLKNFIRWPYITLLNNIKIVDDRDILLTIKDKYQLLGVHISKDVLQEGNLDSIINDLKIIETNYYMRKNKIDIEEIVNICELKKIIDAK